MAKSFDLLIRGGTLVSTTGRVRGDVGVIDGKIAATGELHEAEAADIIEAPGLHVLPGVMDPQVHFREPGGEHKEDLATGSAAAALGGITGVLEMPNTNPPTTSEEAFRDKLSRADGRAWVDFGFYVGATEENASQLVELERLPGCCAVKMFMGSSTGGLLVASDEGVRSVLASGQRRVAVHCEDEERLIARANLRRAGDPSSHPEWRDVKTALRATTRLLTVAREIGRKVHVLHVTTAEEMSFLADHKDLATVETSPQHLTLSAPDCYERLGTYAQMNPPIREGRHREALWQAVTSGVVDVIGSDHAPHTREEKEAGYPDTPSGMPGVQTLLPILLNHVNQGHLPLERVVELTSASVARTFGMKSKGTLAPGYDADLTLVDLDHQRTIDNDWIASRCGWTPFHGEKVQGWPRATIVRGRVIMREDELLGSPIGQAMTFE